MKTEIKRSRSALDVRRYTSPNEVPRNNCYLCGRELLKGDSEKEREHVIPSLLVKPDALEDPLILTACSEHNRLKAYDEEYVVPHIQATSGDYSKQALKSFSHTTNSAKKKLGKILLPDGSTRNRPGAGIIVGMARKITDVDMYSPSGVYLGEGGKMHIDNQRFSDFYERIVKGFYTAARGEVIDWHDFNIKVASGSHTYDKTVPDDAFLTPFKYPTHMDNWSDEVVVCGHVGNSPDEGHPYSFWSIGIFDEHKAVVSISHKKIMLPSLSDQAAS